MTGRRLTVRRGPVSLRLDVRVLATLGALGAVAAAAFTASVAQGDFPVPVADVLAALAGGGDQATSFIVFDLRLPRALTALLVGAALGIAGTIFQDLSRNALVSPDIIGVTSGASLAAITVIVFGGAEGTLTVPLAALGGAVATGAALYALAWRGGLQGYRLVLVGIGVAALMQAGIAYVLTRGEIFEVARAYVWLVGSLNGRGWEHVWPLAATLAVALPLTLALSRQLQALQLGELARALGVGVERTRLALVGLAVLLTGMAVSAAGAIAFVAFFAPHLARRLAGSVSPGSVLPVAAACGAVLVLCADLLGRVAFAGTEIPVGLVTAILAAPYFLLLLQRANRMGATG